MFWKKTRDPAPETCTGTDMYVPTTAELAEDLDRTRCRVDELEKQVALLRVSSVPMNLSDSELRKRLDENFHVLKALLAHLGLDAKIVPPEMAERVRITKLKDGK